MSDTIKYYDDDGDLCQKDDVRCRKFVHIYDYRKLERELATERARLDWLMQTLALNALPLDDWDRDNIDDAMGREFEPKDCKRCGGIGELPGDPHSKQFPTCSDCGGTGTESD